MGNIYPHIEKLLLLFENRIGLVLIVGIAIALFLVENAQPVFSDYETSQEFAPEQVEIEGLVFDPEVFPAIQFDPVQEIITPLSPTPTPSPTIPLFPSPTAGESAIITPEEKSSLDEIIQPTSTPEPTAIPTEIPTPTPLPPTPPPIDPNSDAIWDSLAKCESGGNWQINTGNGYFGGLQFSQGAWNSVGGQGEPHTASREEQISRGKLLQAKRGWGAWGLCAKKLGLN